MIESPFADLEREAGAVMAEHVGVLFPAHYGDPESEYRHVHQAVALIDASFEGVLKLTGSERLRWLNGQITQDVKSLRPGEGKPAAVLNSKGHIVADLAVCGLEGSVWVTCQHDRLETVRSAFEQHIIADDVKIEDATPRWSQLLLAGRRAARLLEEMTGAGLLSAFGGWQHCEASLADVRLRIVSTDWLSIPMWALYIPR